MFICPEKFGEKLVHVFIVNTEKIVNRCKLVVIYSDFVSACLIKQNHYVLYLLVSLCLKNYYSYTQTVFSNSQQYLIFDLLVCCKTEGGADL